MPRPISLLDGQDGCQDGVHLGHGEAILIDKGVENRREIESIMAEMEIVSDKAVSIVASGRPDILNR